MAYKVVTAGAKTVHVLDDGDITAQESVSLREDILSKGENLGTFDPATPPTLPTIGLNDFFYNSADENAIYYATAANQAVTGFSKLPPVSNISDIDAHVPMDWSATYANYGLGHRVQQNDVWYNATRDGIPAGSDPSSDDGTNWKADIPEDTTNIKEWEANTAYTSNDDVTAIDPSDGIRKVYHRNADGTSGATFDATEVLEWTIVGEVVEPTTVYISHTTGNNGSDGKTSATAWADFSNIRVGVNYKIYVMSAGPFGDVTFENQSVSLLAGVPSGFGVFPVLGHIRAYNSKLNINGDLAGDSNQQFTIGNLTAENNTTVLFGNTTSFDVPSGDAIRAGRNSSVYCNYNINVSGVCNRVMIAFGNSQINLRRTTRVAFTGTSLNYLAQSATGSTIDLGDAASTTTVAPTIIHMQARDNGVIKRIPTTVDLADEYLLTDASTGGLFSGWADTDSVDGRIVPLEAQDALNKDHIANTDLHNPTVAAPLQFVRRNAAGDAWEAVDLPIAPDNLKSGPGVPAAGVGVDGDYYLQLDATLGNNDIWGPKAAGAWPAQADFKSADPEATTPGQALSTTGTDYTTSRTWSTQMADIWGASRRVRRVFGDAGDFDYPALGYVDRTAIFIRNSDATNGRKIIYGTGGTTTLELVSASGTVQSVAGQDEYSNLQPNEFAVFEKDGNIARLEIISGERISYYDDYADAATKAITQVAYDGVAVIRDTGEFWGRKTTTNAAAFPADGVPNADWFKTDSATPQTLILNNIEVTLRSAGTNAGSNVGLVFVDNDGNNYPAADWLYSADLTQYTGGTATIVTDKAQYGGVIGIGRNKQGTVKFYYAGTFPNGLSAIIATPANGGSTQGVVVTYQGTNYNDSFANVAAVGGPLYWTTTQVLERPSVSEWSGDTDYTGEQNIAFAFKTPATTVNGDYVTADGVTLEPNKDYFGKYAADRASADSPALLEDSVVGVAEIALMNFVGAAPIDTPFDNAQPYVAGMDIPVDAYVVYSGTDADNGLWQATSAVTGANADIRNEPLIFRGKVATVDRSTVATDGANLSMDVFSPDTGKTSLRWMVRDGESATFIKNSNPAIVEVTDANGLAVITDNGTTSRSILVSGPAIVEFQRNSTQFNFIVQGLAGGSSSNRIFDSIADTDNESFADGEVITTRSEGAGAVNWVFELGATEGDYELADVVSGYFNKLREQTQVVELNADGGTQEVVSFSLADANFGDFTNDLDPTAKFYYVKRNAASTAVQSFESGVTTVIPADDFDWHFFRRIDTNNVEYMGKPFSTYAVVSEVLASIEITTRNYSAGEVTEASQVVITDDDGNALDSATEWKIIYDTEGLLNDGQKLGDTDISPTGTVGGGTRTVGIAYDGDKIVNGLRNVQVFQHLGGNTTGITKIEAKYYSGKSEELISSTSDRGTIDYTPAEPFSFTTIPQAVSAVVGPINPDDIAAWVSGETGLSRGDLRKFDNGTDLLIIGYIGPDDTDDGAAIPGSDWQDVSDQDVNTLTIIDTDAAGGNSFTFYGAPHLIEGTGSSAMNLLFPGDGGINENLRAVYHNKSTAITTIEGQDVPPGGIAIIQADGGIDGPFVWVSGTEAKTNWAYSTDGMNAVHGDKIIVAPDHTINLTDVTDVASIQFAPSTGNWADIQAGTGTFSPDAAWTFGAGQTLPYGSDVLRVVSNLGNTNWLIFVGGTDVPETDQRHQTVASLPLIATVNPGAMGVVWGDPVANNNGVYIARTDGVDQTTATAWVAS